MLILEKLADRKMNRELWAAYNKVMQAVRKELKAFMTDFEALPYYKKVQAKGLYELEQEIIHLLNSAAPKVEQSILDHKERCFFRGLQKYVVSDRRRRTGQAWHENAERTGIAS